MFTFLDLLVVVSMALIAAAVLCVVLMFLVKSKRFQRVCLYITAALGIYIAYVGVRINWLDFYHQAVMAVVLALVGIGAVVLERVKKDNEKMFLVARIAAAAALILGTVNALII